MKNLLILIVLVSTFLHSCAQSGKEKQERIKKTITFFNNQDYINSILFAKKLIKEDSNDFVSWTILGRALFNSGKHDEGIAAISKAININPNYFEAFGHRAIMYDLSGSTDIHQKISDVDKALSNDENNVQLLIIKAVYLHKYGSVNEAIIIYKKALRIEPENYDLNVFLAVANNEIGKTELALNGLNDAIKLDKGIPFAYEERGYLLMELKKFKEAYEDFSRIIELSGNDMSLKAFAYNNRGFVSYNTGEFAQALEDINQSITLFPDNSYAFKNRALVFIKINDLTKACLDLNKSLELGFSQNYGPEVEELLQTNCQ